MTSPFPTLFPQLLDGLSVQEEPRVDQLLPDLKEPPITYILTPLQFHQREALSALIAEEELAYTDSVRPTMQPFLMDASVSVKVVTNESHMVGFIAYRLSKHTNLATIHYVYVLVAHRRRGLSKTLFQGMVEHARATHHTTIAVAVSIDELSRVSFIDDSAKRVSIFECWGMISVDDPVTLKDYAAYQLHL